MNIDTLRDCLEWNDLIIVTTDGKKEATDKKLNKLANDLTTTDTRNYKQEFMSKFDYELDTFIIENVRAGAGIDHNKAIVETLEYCRNLVKDILDGKVD